MEKRIKLTIDDTLAFYNDFVGDYVFNQNNTQTNSYYLRVPLQSLENGQLNVNWLSKFYDYLYGVNWRVGNDDGSRYMPLKAVVEFIGDEQLNDWIVQRTCYLMNIDGQISELTPQEF